MYIYVLPLNEDHSYDDHGDDEHGYNGDDDDDVFTLQSGQACRPHCFCPGTSQAEVSTCKADSTCKLRSSTCITMMSKMSMMRIMKISRANCGPAFAQ